MTRFDELVRRIGICVLLLPFGLAALAVTPAGAQTASDDEDDDRLFRVERIEISGFGGWIGGETYLELPPPLTPLTNDTGAQDILDFSGEVPNPEVIAPTKKIEPGWMAGFSTTFYLTPNFGISLKGTFGQSETVFTGQEVFIEPDPEDPLGLDTIEVVQPRSEIDRAKLRTWTGEAGIIYHILAERKHNTRPFVTLGIGGILNQFPETEDVSALTWNVGLGVGFPVYKSIRGFVSGGLKFYVWETNEVDLDQTLVFPEVTAGIVWRYMVPEEEVEPVIEPASPTEGEGTPQGG
jgi:hypothetical protein